MLRERRGIEARRKKRAVYGVSGVGGREGLKLEGRNGMRSIRC